MQIMEILVIKYLNCFKNAKLRFIHLDLFLYHLDLFLLMFLSLNRTTIFPIQFGLLMQTLHQCFFVVRRKHLEKRKQPKVLA